MKLAILVLVVLAVACLVLARLLARSRRPPLRLTSEYEAIAALERQRAERLRGVPVPRAGGEPPDAIEDTRPPR